MKHEEMERKYVYWLCRVPGIGNRSVRKLMQACGSAEAVYRGGEKLWSQFLTAKQVEAMACEFKETDPERAYAVLQKKGIRFLLEGDEEYPERLRNIPDAPFVLFCIGDLPDEDALSVAVIGARDCSEYGRFVAARLGEELGRQGVQVVSGMARGIDGISQKAAIDAGGRSFGVLGSGVDVCYPRENRPLYDRLREQGGILSTYPPGTEACPQNFPPRNRIVSGLADVLVVIEAREKSGTLITVDMALEQGRDVYVVPGRVTDRLSDGCNRLLKQGAGVFLSPEDFLEEVGGAWSVKKGTNRKNEEGALRPSDNSLALEVPFRVRQLPSELQEVYAVLELQPMTVEEIQARLGGGYALPHLTAVLMRLCMENLAEQLTPGHFCRSQN